MSSSSSSPSPLTPSSIRAAHSLIAPYIHRTPLLTCATLDRLANTPLSPSESPSPRFSLFFKAENLQKTGAFKARGAHHALLRLLSQPDGDGGGGGGADIRRRGVVTHSSGNHAQALALAARTLGVRSVIVMPRISTPSKIAGTRAYADSVLFSGSTSVERERVVERVVAETGAVLVPPYDDVEVVVGQGTVGLEMDEQFKAMREGERRAREEEAEKRRVKVKEAKGQEEFERGMDGWFERMKSGLSLGPGEVKQEEGPGKTRAVCSEAVKGLSSSTGNSEHALDAVIAPIGGGGLLGGIATYFFEPTSTSRRRTLVFGAEPQFEGANDAELGLKAGKRVEHVSTLTIADGLRTPVGLVNWEIVSDKEKVEGIYSVTEEQIKNAMRLVFERMKLVVEPSGCVPLAVILYNAEFRRKVAEMQKTEGKESWDVGVVFSGGNTTMDAIVALYSDQERPRDEGKMGMDGKREAEDVAG